MKIFADETVVDSFVLELLPEKGVCIEIGANTISNSHCFHLYKKGWRGIVIEADPNTCKNLQDAYDEFSLPDVKIYNYAICKDNGTKIFYSHNVNNSGLSSLYYNHATGLADPGHKILREVIPFEVETKTLETLVEENECCEIDYLQIDTEGADAEIILSTDFSKVKPKIIFAETNKLHCYLGTDVKKCPEVWEMVSEHLSKYNYKLIAVIKNEAYVKQFCPDIGDTPMGAIWELNK